MKEPQQAPPQAEFRRRQLIVYPKLQWTILAIIPAVACISSLITISVMRVLAEAQSRQALTQSIVLISLLLIFIALASIVVGLYFTNRIFGPLYRIHKEIKSFTNTHQTRSISLRKGDYFRDFFDDFNKLIDDYSKLKEKTK